MAIIALGTFDGVHSGHRTLLRIMCEEAGKCATQSIVHTFSNHPRMVFAKAPALLMPDEQRLAMLSSLGDSVAADVFTKEYAALSPEDFILNLKNRFDIDAVVTGYNYTFGVRGEGDTNTLCALGDKYGFRCITVPPCLYKDAPVSSTRIRETIRQGNMRDAAAMLTRPFEMCGEIVANREIGSKIGFPTANIDWPREMILPRVGVYASLAELDGKMLYAVTNVGDNPTVNGGKISVETHILNMNMGNQYNKTLKVRFIEYLRGEIRFNGLEELRMQIERDKKRALEILADIPAENGKI